MSICAVAPPASAAPEPHFPTRLSPESAVSSAGERRAYRQQGNSGRFVESFFCPICGTAVLFRAEGLPGTVGVPVGCFADPRFTKPSKLFWASRRHHWLDLPDDIALVDTQ
ncbi:MAG TPA: GFA family protein [Methyloceanibacter sp.]|nr:GFA family protein [Methyloceanibacter sp.]